MNRKLVVNDPAVGRFVADTAHCGYNPMVDHTIGIVDASLTSIAPAYVRGGVIFTSYTHSAIWMHSAGRGGVWATPDFLWAIFHYPFVGLGVRRIYAVIEEANDLAMRIDARLGFKEQTRLPDLFASGAGVIVYMEKSDCRWLHVKPRTIRATESDSPDRALKESDDGRREREYTTSA